MHSTNPAPGFDLQKSNIIWKKKLLNRNANQSKILKLIVFVFIIPGEVSYGHQVNKLYYKKSHIVSSYYTVYKPE